MGDRVQEKRLVNPNQHLQNFKEPKNIDEVVGTGPLMITDYFATLDAVFKTAVYGPLNTWSEFWQNVGNRAALTFKKRRLELYNKIKGPHDKLQVARKVRFSDEAKNLQTQNKNLKKFEVFKTSISNKDLKEIKAVLPKNYTGSDRMISLKKIARDPKISREIRQLINQKLNQALKNKKFIEYIPEDPYFYRYQMLKKAAAIIGTSTILALGVYYSNKISNDLPLGVEPTTTPSEDVQNLATTMSSPVVTKVVQPTSAAVKQTKQPVIAQTKPITTASLTTNTSIVRSSFWNFWSQRVIDMDKDFQNARNIDDTINTKINKLNQWLKEHIDRSIEGFRSSNQTRSFSNEMLPTWKTMTDSFYRVWNFVDEFTSRIDQKTNKHLEQIGSFIAKNVKKNELNPCFSEYVDSSIEGFRSFNQTRFFSNEMLPTWKTMTDSFYRVWSFVDEFTSRIDKKSTNHLKQIGSFIANLRE